MDKKLNQEVIETEYEKIFNGTVREKVRLAKRFKCLHEGIGGIKRTKKAKI